jgi:prevent-host-death family protein
MEKWKLQDAKNRFSEVVQKAMDQGPQWVTRRGKDAVVVLSASEYRRLSAPKPDLAEFLRKSPLFEVELDLERKKDLEFIIPDFPPSWL